MEVKDLLVLLVTPTTQVALIIALAELIKGLGCPTKFIPLIDLGLGILSGILVFGILCDVGIPYGILIGIALGLSACGLFSGIKNLKGA